MARLELPQTFPHEAFPFIVSWYWSRWETEAWRWSCRCQEGCCLGKSVVQMFWWASSISSVFQHQKGPCPGSTLMRDPCCQLLAAGDGRGPSVSLMWPPQAQRGLRAGHLSPHTMDIPPPCWIQPTGAGMKAGPTGHHRDTVTL